MKFAILGSGAVGGYFGAKLCRAGHDVTFIARGAHLEAIRARGLSVTSEALGNFTVHARGEQDTTRVGPVDVVLFAVKTYDNTSALPLLPPLLGPDTVVLTLQNGVDSPDEVASVAGRERTLGGSTYIATALETPGHIVQTGDHRRIVFGEAFGPLPRVTDRVTRLHDAFTASDIQSDPVGDSRVPIWEKFIFLAAMAAFTGAARLPIGPVWGDPFTRRQFLGACREIESVARANGIAVAPDVVDRIGPYLERIPPTMRSSLLIDLQAGRRIEVDALQGSVVRRAAQAGVAVPIMATLYAVLKLYAVN